MKTNNNSSSGRLTKELEFCPDETSQVLDLMKSNSNPADKDESFFVNSKQISHLEDLMISMTPKLSPAHLNCLETIRIRNGWHEPKLIADNDTVSDRGTEADMDSMSVGSSAFNGENNGENMEGLGMDTSVDLGVEESEEM